MDGLLEKLTLIGVVPVVKLEDPADAVPLAKALIEGDLPCAEITFRARGADESIRRISEAYPAMLVGAGTVLTVEQADAARAAGAKFIVSPGLNEKVVRYCLERDILAIPGCASPSDVERAIGLGLGTVKFFPAEAMGGLPTIKAMAAPYGNMRFMPTGGIGPGNLSKYLAFPQVIACGGSWITREDLICAGRFDEISMLARQAIELVLGFELSHVGINAGSAAEAEALVNAFAPFGFASSETENSFFAGSAVEAMKFAAYGTKGHIAIATNSVERAAAYLRAKGFHFVEQSACRDQNGRLCLLYILEEIGGFAVHLVQK